MYIYTMFIENNSWNIIKSFMFDEELIMFCCHIIDGYDSDSDSDDIITVFCDKPFFGSIDGGDWCKECLYKQNKFIQGK